MERGLGNTLRVLGIVGTVILVWFACLWPLLFAWVIVTTGGLTQWTLQFRALVATGFVAAILAVIALVTVGVLIIRKLAKGIVRGPGSQLLATTSVPVAAAEVSVRPSIPAPASRFVRPHLSPSGRKTIDRLVLALGAQIAVSAITLFQIANRPLVPRNWTPMLLPPFLLLEVPYVLLIYFLLKRPGRRAFTFLIAVLVCSILETFFNPAVLYSYLQIYRDHPVGLLWVAFSGLVYVIISVLAYQAIQQTGLRPELSFAILATVATFFYFMFVLGITPHLYRLWISTADQSWYH